MFEYLIPVVTSLALGLPLIAVWLFGIVFVGNSQLSDSAKQQITIGLVIAIITYLVSTTVTTAGPMLMIGADYSQTTISIVFFVTRIVSVSASAIAWGLVLRGAISRDKGDF